MKKWIPFLLSAALLQADLPDLAFQEEHFRPAVVPVNEPLPMREEEKAFSYFGLGLNTFLYLPCSPDLSIGMRKTNSHHVWDMNLGVNFGIAYGQASYLYFFKPVSGFYLGAGLTGGISYASFESAKVSPYLNLPLTFGKQYVTDKSYRFWQLQITPLLTTTLSYGIGF